MKRSLLCTSILLACAHSNAIADLAPEESEIERITVRGAFFGQSNASGVKTPTVLLDVPQSVSIISEEQILQQSLFSVADAMQYTPGVSIGQGEDHRDQITIRGQNTTADFFLDGVRDDVQYFRPLYNLERIEVLRGSNALLFGRGGGGGVVNRVTKVAERDESFVQVNAGLDTFSASTMAIDANHAISDDSAVRLNAVSDSIDNHRNFKDGNRYAINPTFTRAFGEDTVLFGSYEYVNDDRIVDRGIPSSNGRPLDGVYDVFFGSTDINVTKFEAHIARLRIEHQINDDWSINATGMHADYDKLYQNIYPAGFDAETSSVTVDGYIDTTERENSLFQLNIVGQLETGSIKHTLLMGAEYGDQKTDNARRDTFFLDSQDDQISFMFRNSLIAVEPVPIPDVTFTDPVRDRSSDVIFTSVFIQDEIALTENWILVAGARYDNFEIDVLDSIEVNDGAADGNNGILASDDTEVSPRAGLIYKPNDDMSIYASYSKSFLPRSGDQFLTLSLTTQALDAEEFENRELGVKWNISNSLTIDAALFEIERDNGATVDPNDPERSIITGTETRGFEIQLTGQVTDYWNINAGYSHLDGEEMGRVVDGAIANRQLAQLPEHMLSVWNQFTLNDKWQAGLGVIGQSEQFTSLSNNVELPGFVRVDAALFYRPNDKTVVQLNVENVLDQNYFPAAHNDNNISTGEPLNARLSVQYRF